MEEGHAPERQTGLPTEGTLVCASILHWVLGEGPPCLREDAGVATDSGGGTEGRLLADAAPALK